MGSSRRRHSRSRSRRKRAVSSSGSPAPLRKTTTDKRRGSPKSGSRLVPQQKSRKTPTAAVTEGSQESEDGSAGESRKVSLQARVALLEVENAALKAENAELKKRLIVALQPAASRKAAVNAKPGQPPSRESTPERPVAEPPVDARRARLAAAEAEPSSARRQQRQREEGSVPAKKQDGDSPEEAEEDGDTHPNAVMLCNGAMEAYNEQVPNNIPLEKRLPLVKEKLDRFMDCFGASIQIVDLKSGGAVIRDRKMFCMRYGCVFRESGSKLKGTVHKRFYFDADGKRPTYCLDFETHASLVTATPGTPPDGKLGVREPRTEHLVVLYEEKGGKITRMWLKPDTHKLGLDPTAGEDILVRSDTYREFETKLKELKSDNIGEFIFQNYHDTPTVG